MVPYAHPWLRLALAIRTMMPSVSSMREEGRSLAAIFQIGRRDRLAAAVSQPQLRVLLGSARNSTTRWDPSVQRVEEAPSAPLSGPLALDPSTATMLGAAILLAGP